MQPSHPIGIRKEEAQSLTAELTKKQEELAKKKGTVTIKKMFLDEADMNTWKKLGIPDDCFDSASLTRGEEANNGDDGRWRATGAEQPTGYFCSFGGKENGPGVNQKYTRDHDTRTPNQWDWLPSRAGTTQDHRGQVERARKQTVTKTKEKEQTPAKDISKIKVLKRKTTLPS